MKSFVTLGFAIVLLCLFFSTVLAEERTILVIPKGERVQYWQWVKQGAMHAGRDRGVNVIYRGPRISDDYQAQLGIIRKGLEDNVDAIVLAPNHVSLARPLLEQAVQNGIVVVVIDSDIELEGRTSYVATDNYRAGQEAAHYLLSSLEHEGSVLLLRYKENNASTIAREKGFLDVLSKEQSVREVIVSGYVGVSVGNAYRRTRDILEKNSKIEAIFASGESTTVGCLKALEEMGLVDEVKLVGFDYTVEIHQALEEKKIHGVVLQRPYQMGYLGVIAACDAIDGQQVKKRIVTKAMIATEVQDVHQLDLP